MRIQRASNQRSLIRGRSNVSGTDVTFKNFDEETRFLRKMVDAAPKDLALRELTLGIVFPGCESRAEECQALAIGEWVQRNIRYVHEGIETFQRPQTTLRVRAGDCDDFTTLISSMLATIGIKSAMCLVQIEGRWAHIFPVALVRTPEGLHRLTLDATLPEPISDMVNPLAKLAASGRNVTRVKFV